MNDGVLRCAEKTFVLLEALASREGMPAGVGELSRRTGLAKSTVHRLLKSFQEFRLVEQRNAKYTLSSRITELGEFACAWPPATLRAHLQPWLQDLHRMTHAIVRTNVLYGSFDVCISAVYDHDSLDLALMLDDRGFAGSTVTGKAILAYSPEDLQDKVAHDPQLTEEEQSPRTARFYQEMTRIRTMGWAGTPEDAANRTVTVASPVLNECGQAVAALAVTERPGLRKPKELAPIVLSVAGAASMKIYVRK